MERLNLARWASRLIEEARVARLGLVDDAGRPRVLPITYAVHGGAVWSAVDDKPKSRPGRELARLRWLRARPRATLLVDVYDEDWDELAWVQLIGEVAILDDPEPGALEALRGKYGPYRERPPGGPFLRLAVMHASCWRAREQQEA